MFIENVLVKRHNRKYGKNSGYVLDVFERHDLMRRTLRGMIYSIEDSIKYFAEGGSSMLQVGGVDEKYLLRLYNEVHHLHDSYVEWNPPVANENKDAVWFMLREDLHKIIWTKGSSQFELMRDTESLRVFCNGIREVEAALENIKDFYEANGIELIADKVYMRKIDCNVPYNPNGKFLCLVTN